MGDIHNPVATQNVKLTFWVVSCDFFMFSPWQDEYVHDIFKVGWTGLDKIINLMFCMAI